jgi:hypothetical protein
MSIPPIIEYIMAGYYDLVLGLIPLSLAGISGALLSIGFTLTTAIPLAAIVSVGLIGHAMFIRGPVGPSPPPRETPKAAD